MFGDVIKLEINKGLGFKMPCLRPSHDRTRNVGCSLKRGVTRWLGRIVWGMLRNNKRCFSSGCGRGLVFGLKGCLFAPLGEKSLFGIEEGLESTSRFIELSMGGNVVSWDDAIGL